jgi:cobalt-zinc-cadmium efflux system outer membrane protein
MVPMPLEEAFVMAQQNRPDIRALRLQVFKSRADVHAENRNAYPEVSVFGGYTRFPEGSTRDDNYNAWGIGLTVTVPVFDRNQGNRARAKSTLAQSNHQLQLGIVDLRAEIVEADRDFRTAHQQTHTIADEEVRLTTEVRDIMLEGFRAGGCPLIDVLDAERSYRETMRLFVTSRADYWRAMYIYNIVVGINSSNDVRSPAH